MKKWQKILFVAVSIMTLLCTMVVPSLAYSVNEDKTLSPTTVLGVLYDDTGELYNEALSGYVTVDNVNIIREWLFITLSDPASSGSYTLGVMRVSEWNKDTTIRYYSVQDGVHLFTASINPDQENDLKINIIIENHSVRSPFAYCDSVSVRCDFYATPTEVNSHIKNITQGYETQLEDKSAIIDNLTTQNGVIRDQNAELLADNVALTEERNTLKGVVEELTESNGKLLTEKQDAEYLYEHTKSDLDYLQGLYDTQTAQYDRVKYERDYYLRENNKLKSVDSNILFSLFSGIGTGFKSLIDPILGINLSPNATTAVTVGTFVGFAVIAAVVIIIIKLTKR